MRTRCSRGGAPGAAGGVSGVRARCVSGALQGNLFQGSERERIPAQGVACARSERVAGSLSKGCVRGGGARVAAQRTAGRPPRTPNNKRRQCTRPAARHARAATPGRACAHTRTRTLFSACSAAVSSGVGLDRSMQQARRTAVCYAPPRAIEPRSQKSHKLSSAANFTRVLRTPSAQGAVWGLRGGGVGVHLRPECLSAMATRCSSA